jgi:hypothetical protein
VLSLDKVRFCKVLATLKYEKYFEFTKGINWIDSSTFLMTSEMNGMVLTSIDNSKVSGLKLTNLNSLQAKHSKSTLFEKGYCRSSTILKGHKGVNIVSLKAKSLEVEALVT